VPLRNYSLTHLPEVELVDGLLAADELGLTTDIAPDADSRTHKWVKKCISAS